MGGRGASSGMSIKGKPYGTEYESFGEVDNVKIVRYKYSSTTAPMETMTNGRIYATIDKDNDVKHISFYDENGKRVSQIDIKGVPHKGKLPHHHIGYWHDENGTRDLTDTEQILLDKVLNYWDGRRKQLGM